MGPSFVMENNDISTALSVKQLTMVVALIVRHLYERINEQNASMVENPAGCESSLGFTGAAFPFSVTPYCPFSIKECNE